ncbi:MAG: cysteine desulfurase family protein, partial [Acidobacteriota bacterium]
VEEKRFLRHGGQRVSASGTGIYLDHHATTPCDPRVLDAMLPCFAEDFGNPSSRQHAWGRRAAERVERARAQVADLLGAESSEIVFTSGATESNNLALFGAVDALSGAAGRGQPHVVTQVTEHKAVLDACAVLEDRGVDVTYLPVDAGGRLDPVAVADALRESTVLVSVMLANNEIGTIQPVAEIADICRRRGVWLHTDAAQALALLDCRIESLGADLVSLSGHKAYGPKGVGALYVRRRRPRVRLVPRQVGGGHERGRRSGTLDVPSIVGFGRACELIRDERDGDARRLAGLRDRLLDGLRRAFPDLVVNGTSEHRLPNNLNISLPGTVAADLLDELRDVALSSGSACTSTAGASSHVLAALGDRGRDLAESALRFGLGRTTREEHLDAALDELRRAFDAVRARGPRAEAVCGVPA